MFSCTQVQNSRAKINASLKKIRTKKGGTSSNTLTLYILRTYEGCRKLIIYILKRKLATLFHLCCHQALAEDGYYTPLLLLKLFHWPVTKKFTR